MEERNLNINHQHIYSALRSALVDRDRDTDEEYDNHVLVTIDEFSFALKREVPSGALLISYMTLFYPDFLSACQDKTDRMFYCKNWMGGEQNKNMPLFTNETMFGIALAIGVYAGFLQTLRHPIVNVMVMRAKMDTPMVQRTYELIKENKLVIEDARDVFIALMQDEEYRVSIPVADDYIANTSWIIEESVGVSDDGPEQIEITKPQEEDK